MKLSQLLSVFPQLKLGQYPTREVSGIYSDSRQVGPDAVFVAVRGYTMDAHDFIPQACQAGAIAVIVESEDKVPVDYQGAIVVVENTREALDQLAARFYGGPADQLFCVGVTGTNGKTTVTYMIEKVLTDFGWKTGVLGTIDHHMGETKWASALTTPDSLTLQKRLSEMKSLGAQAVAFEVSSHAIVQNRADNIPFDATVFTNLTRDHLDYHGTMEEYFAAKEKLFRETLARSNKENCYAVINSDDSYGPRLQVTEKAKVWTYGQRKADFTFRVLEQDFSGTRFHLTTPRGDVEVFIRTPGLHNVYNATAAIAVGVAAGASLDKGALALSSFAGVPGRLESVETDKDIHVFVDYAHTDDALRSVLNALNKVRENVGRPTRIITVFGCGGDRDKGKRPLMAQAAMEGSDLVFVTSDNPRREDPQKIIDDIMQAVPDSKLNQEVFGEVDRKEAIRRALQMANAGDVVLIAGKGHEDYQIVGDEKRPFSDVAVVKELL